MAEMSKNLHQNGGKKPAVGTDGKKGWCVQTSGANQHDGIRRTGVKGRFC